MRPHGSINPLHPSHPQNSTQPHATYDSSPLPPLTPYLPPPLRLHAAPCATYESGSLRRFHAGRTDVIRSCSSHTLAYSMAMVDPEASLVQRADALKVAVAAHSKYSKDVSGPYRLMVLVGV